MYSVVGEFKSFNFSVEVKDIFPMNLGSASYTEYEFDSSFIKYRMEHPESFEWVLGHIHSHNTMSAWFSKTDLDELQDNAPNHNYYLSLIVNNAMRNVAKIAFVGSQKIEGISYRTFTDDNGEVVTQSKDFVNEEQVLFHLDCEIAQEIDPIRVDTSFSQRVKYIEEEQSKKPANKVYNNYADSFNTKPNKNKRQSLLRRLLVDSFMLEYNSVKTLDEALFNANIDFQSNPDCVATMVMFFNGYLQIRLDEGDTLTTEDIEFILDELDKASNKDFDELVDSFIELLLQTEDV